ncbi:hypothetical protein PEC302110_26750 [Pectobacterium araliae]|uniref:Tyr recombinase domain-containing protein n=1 Tax=Pectobacterium araliae TaxID=3073862 RepID=A0AAN0MLT7_9GAMM|nr:hypothetical protein PEC302110_26750 [Pectobacterium sp. MAFF 302110]
MVPLSKQAIAILKELHAISGEHKLVFIGFSHADKPISENTINKALRVMGYDTKTEVCGHGFRTMACSALIESGLWSRDAVELQVRWATFLQNVAHIVQKSALIERILFFHSPIQSYHAATSLLPVYLSMAPRN